MGGIGGGESGKIKAGFFFFFFFISSCLSQHKFKFWTKIRPSIF